MKINAYGICHSLGCTVTYYIFVTVFLNKLPKISNDWDLIALGLLIFALLGSRLMSLLQNDIKLNDFHKINQGGISGFGSYYMGFIYLWLISYIYEENTLLLMESMLLSCSMYLIFVRFGNYCKGELGGIYSNYWKCNHPSQIYQLLSEGILITIILWSFYNRLGEGIIFMTMPILLGLFRFVCESFKKEEGGIPIWYQNTLHKYLRFARFQAIIFPIIFYIVYNIIKI